MRNHDRCLHDALAQIARLAQRAVNGNGDTDGEDDAGAGEYGAGRPGEAGRPCCSLKSLPQQLLVRAAETAVAENPMNAPAIGPIGAVAADLVLDPSRLAVLTAKYWGPARRRLTVSFLDSPSATLRRKILAHLNAWNRTAGVSFVETNGVGNVRISRTHPSGGFWSYLGTDILHIAQNQPTMNLEGFTANTPDREFTRVVRHEAGHTLGFPHEHMRRAIVARIDPEKAYRYFGGSPNFWPRNVVDQQVLTPLDERSIMGTPADETSIMCYQLPGTITRDGRPILGGPDINATDYTFAGRIYPKQASSALEQAVPSSDESGGEEGRLEEGYLEEPLAAAD